MDAIADELGVTTPALYSHVSGRDEILRLAAAEMIRELEPVLVEVADWREWLTRWATLLRARLGEVGEELLEAIDTSLDIAALQLAEQGITLLVAAGLGPDEAGHALWLTARIAFTAGPPGHGSRLPVESARAVIGDDAGPVMAEALDAVGAADADDSFAFDLEVLVAGLASRLDDQVR